ncbi:MAG: 4-hydroxy-2-oxovalerate aldolase [Planctomycetaceae bacterium]|nr:4-hydroxy-2-oxovalerate aldolase [Planctomycetaceae bacterium]
MRQSKTLSKLRAGGTVRICGLGHFIPAFLKHAAHFGFDCIWLDNEHRAMQQRELQALLAYFHLFDIDCMLRPPTLERTRLYRFFEDGATGLMIPFVSTPEKARELVQAVKFPPIGDRGLDGAGLDSDFYLRGGEGYTDRANAETFLVVQIETPEAVQNAEAIAAVEGVDALFVGPADLSLRLRNSDTSLTLEAATEQVAAAADRHGKAWGRPVADREQLHSLHAQGARLLAYGGDFLAFLNLLRERGEDFDALLEPTDHESE